ncbi:helix-turn-helix domain-containing protein [Actinomadura craniellae]|nr:helix-turn-helix transcriptional regulator [Actinomadura craniellae]
MREALARADMPAVVALMRAAAGLSQRGLGELVGWSQGAVSLLERGRRDTLYDIRKLLEFADMVGMPRTALAPLILGRPNAILEEDGIPHLVGGIMDRRDFHGMAAGLLLSALMPHIRIPDRVGATDVRYLQAALDHIATRDQSTGGGAVLDQALRQFARARRMLDEADYTEAVGQDLLVVTANLGTLCGWVAYDSGNQPLARSLYTEVQPLANSSGSAEVQADVWLLMSMQAAGQARATGQRGYAREALRLANLASTVARNETSPKLHALIALRQAKAYASLGDSSAFRNAILRARREIDRGSDPTDPAWCDFVSAGEVDGQEATSYMLLGDHDRAVSLRQLSLNDSSLSPRNRICAQAQFARALFEAGDQTEAVKIGYEVLPAFMKGGMTSARPLNWLTGVRKAAEQSGDMDFCQMFDAARRSVAA